ncbi:conserved exported hypothetical protein [Microbacterium sp. 8M]|uniref:histidine-type phosphatase n=1 Tax=Microbacterium sp. 8M TaxID=2653153 RepID=UPI0012EF9486|nr:histidine-type phosphatase [Microbacterium sp. 8M]VXC02083.1 conserved exported hypothetical protein [Microbacterium sp. 8M]
MPAPALRRVRAGLAAVALGALVAGIAAPPASALGTEPDNRYSSKQPYIAPTTDDIAAYQPAPAGYRPLATESVARHGSRGLSGYKYDALLRRMAETAQAEGGFRSPEIGAALLANIDALTAANVENGYGMLTGQGAAQHQGIGARAYQRNAGLFAAAAAHKDRIVAETSGEARATESGENFLRGFTAAASGSRTPSADVPLESRPDLLYFHKVENPDGTEKAVGSPERIRAQAYEDYIAAQTGDGGTISAAMDYIESLPASVSSAEDVLSGIFTPAFIAAIGTDAAHRWYNTANGTKGGPRACAPGADPVVDPDACGDPKKSIKTPVDAAMTLYNLYIIAADMEAENVPPHAFDFSPYFAGHEADAQWFATLLDAEDFYEKGPSLAGHDDTYRVAQPLLDDFFSVIDARAAGGDVAATFRFAHAETIMPFAALLHLPGSTVQAPDVPAPASPADVYGTATNPWRGSLVSPMAANVQWDAVQRRGVDPSTKKPWTPLVRMLVDEREVPFRDGCTPVAPGSHWVKLTELKRCLSGIPTPESPLLDGPGRR